MLLPMVFLFGCSSRAETRSSKQASGVSGPQLEEVALSEERFVGLCSLPDGRVGCLELNGTLWIIGSIGSDSPSLERFVLASPRPGATLFHSIACSSDGRIAIGTKSGLLYLCTVASPLNGRWVDADGAVVAFLAFPPGRNDKVYSVEVGGTAESPDRLAVRDAHSGAILTFGPLMGNPAGLVVSRELPIVSFVGDHGEAGEIMAYKNSVDPVPLGVRIPFGDTPIARLEFSEGIVWGDHSGRLQWILEAPNVPLPLRSLRVLATHDGPLASIVSIPGRRWVASGDHSGSVVVRDTKNSGTEARFQVGGETDIVDSLCVDANESSIYAAVGRRVIRLRVPTVLTDMVSERRMGSTPNSPNASR